MNRPAPGRIALSGALLALGLLVAAPVAGAKPAQSDEPFKFTCTEELESSTAATASADQELDDHPSGKDRTEERGGSGTQGRSDSDPDGMDNDGADKPECQGGYDDDRDGNNGCGNDDDFEDDNNGNCGGKRKVEEADDGPVAAFGVPEEPAEEPADEPAPAPVVKATVPEVETPDVVEDPAPVEEEEGPIVWSDEDDANDPDPDYEYPSDTSPTTEAPADSTGSPALELAAHRDLSRTGGLLALGLLAAGGVLFGTGRRVLALARRR
ncbi:MAG: hypothetical protein ACRDZ7_07655 [Acidimicrobiia bacterium]